MTTVTNHLPDASAAPNHTPRDSTLAEIHTRAFCAPQDLNADAFPSEIRRAPESHSWEAPCPLGHTELRGWPSCTPRGQLQKRSSNKTQLIPALLK